MARSDPRTQLVPRILYLPRPTAAKVHPLVHDAVRYTSSGSRYHIHWAIPNPRRVGRSHAWCSLSSATAPYQLFEVAVGSRKGGS